MNKDQRKDLTSKLAAHVKAIASDLRAQMAAPGTVRDRAKKLHADEQVGDDFDVWTDLLSRRAAVLWVLKTVYVRVLEDRKLLVPGRLVDREAQELFEKLAPNLGYTAFLRWVFRDLASTRGGLPELFAPQPAEVAVPSDARSHALLEFWRHKEADTGFTWSFADEEFAGELMGDLYQELDPVVKDRYALCQTPDFVRDFMLGQTLAPAMAELGGDAVRLLDPACGSGHFLLDGLRRIVAVTAAQHPDWDKRTLVEHALERVVGIDLNDYACALARARMVMTAAELAGVQSLAEAAQFHPHVYWADGLEQIERDDERPAEQIELIGGGPGGKAKEVPPKAVLTRPSVRLVLRPLLKQKFHVVVGNPPYIAEQDEAKRLYHRQRLSGRQRYVTAYREYTLACVFVERALQLLAPGGQLGFIVENAFIKWPRGKPLIEQVLPSVDLRLVVDTSQVPLPHHGTTTVMLFCRQSAATTSTVRAVLSKRGEAGGTGGAPGKVWSSIVGSRLAVGYDDDYISIVDVPRERLSTHPWTLRGGGAAELRARLEKAGVPLASVVHSIGLGLISGADAVFVQDASTLRRHRVSCARPLAAGDGIREWSVRADAMIVWPHGPKGEAAEPSAIGDALRFLWPYRQVLKARKVFGKALEARGLDWWSVKEVYKDKLATKWSIVVAGVATQNHFALDRAGLVFNNRSAPVLKLKPGATEEEHLLLLALLNSSVVCFWMKQVFQPKSHSGQKHHPDPERAAFEFAASGLEKLPVPELEDRVQI